MQICPDLFNKKLVCNKKNNAPWINASWRKIGNYFPMNKINEEEALEFQS